MRKWVAGVMALLLGLNLVAALADTPAGKGPIRAKNPKFPKSVTDLFDADARESISGERPNLAASPAPANTGGNSGTNSGAPATGGTGGSFAWSKISTGDAIVNELKSFKATLGDDVRAPGPFKIAGSKRVRRVFSEYAVLFAIISEYDGEVRWKPQAIAARDLIARCAFNCKAATDGTFNETKQRMDDMETLLNGGNLPAPADADPKNNWPKIADRRQLMARIEEIQKTMLEIASNETEFKKGADRLANLSQILGLLTAASIKPGYDYFDDKEFIGFAEALIKSCQEITEAAGAKAHDRVTKAMSDGTKACANCHSAYRS